MDRVEPPESRIELQSPTAQEVREARTANRLSYNEIKCAIRGRKK